MRDHKVNGLFGRMRGDHSRVAGNHLPHPGRNLRRKPRFLDIDPVKIKLQRRQMRRERPADMAGAVQKGRPPRQGHRRDKTTCFTVETGRCVTGIAKRCRAIHRMCDCAAGFQIRQHGILIAGEPFKQHAHLPAAALPHIGAKRGAHHRAGPWRCRAVSQHLAGAGHHSEFQRAATDGLPDIIFGDQHHRAGFARGGPLYADEAGPHHSAMRADPLTRRLDPVGHHPSPEALPSATPGPPSRRAARHIRSGVAGASSAG